MATNVRHPSPTAGSLRTPSPPGTFHSPGAPVTAAPGALAPFRSLTALELAHLAATLAISLKKPADECFGEAEALHSDAEKWLTGFADPDGPEHLYNYGQQTILNGRKSLNEVCAFPEIEVDLTFYTADSDEPGHDKIAVRAITTWRGLQKAIERLQRDGIFDEFDSAVADVEKARVTRASVRAINEARIYSEGMIAIRRRGAIVGLAAYQDPETKETRTIKLNTEKDNRRN